MSAPLTAAEILFRQRLLKAEGYYAGKLDGVWGPKTQKAEYDHEDQAVRIDTADRVDSRSAGRILTLALPMQEKACQIIRLLDRWQTAVVAKAVSGTRTYAEQEALHLIGRHGIPGEATVTNAKGGESNHNFGIAIDIAIWTDGRLITADPLYQDAGEYVLSQLDGIEWGGRWKKPDYPHYQLATGLTIDETRRRFEIGASYFGNSLMICRRCHALFVSSAYAAPRDLCSRCMDKLPKATATAYRRFEIDTPRALQCLADHLASVRTFDGGRHTRRTG